MVQETQIKGKKMKNLKQYIRSKIYESLMNEEMATKDVNSTMSTTSGNEKISSQPYQSMSAYDTQQPTYQTKDTQDNGQNGPPEGWNPQGAPDYVGPYGDQIWYDKGPPQRIWIYKPASSDPLFGHPPLYSYYEWAGNQGGLFAWRGYNSNGPDVRGELRQIIPGWTNPGFAPPDWDTIEQSLPNVPPHVVGQYDYNNQRWRMGLE